MISLLYRCIFTAICLNGQATNKYVFQSSGWGWTCFVGSTRGGMLSWALRQVSRSPLHGYSLCHLQTLPARITFIAKTHACYVTLRNADLDKMAVLPSQHWSGCGTGMEETFVLPSYCFWKAFLWFLPMGGPLGFLPHSKYFQNFLRSSLQPNVHLPLTDVGRLCGLPVLLLQPLPPFVSFGADWMRQNLWI
jgi:hypothetical protein